MEGLQGYSWRLCSFSWGWWKCPKIDCDSCAALTIWETIEWSILIACSEWYVDYIPITLLSKKKETRKEKEKRKENIGWMNGQMRGSPFVFVLTVDTSKSKKNFKSARPEQGPGSRLLALQSCCGHAPLLKHFFPACSPGSSPPFSLLSSLHA